MPYSSMLYCANIDSLASRSKDLSREYFHYILDPASCLHSLLPPPRSTAITSRLRSSQTFPLITATVPSSNMLSTIISKSSCSIIFSAFASHFYYYPQHYVPCTFMFAFSFLYLISPQSLFEFVFFYRCLDLIVYIVPFIIVLYLSIQLQSCQSVWINLLTYLLTYLQGVDSQFATAHLQAQSPLTQGWHYHAACDRINVYRHTNLTAIGWVVDWDTAI